MRNVELTRLRKLLKKISSLLIVTHNNPDPDALGSAFALSVLAKNLKVRSNIFYGGFISRPENKRMVALLKIRPLLKKRVQSRDYQAVAFVDCQAAGRNHPLPEYEGAIEIDHHPRIRRRKGLISIVESGVGATATLLFEILMKMKVPISSPVATGLFYGIKTDTDNLSRGTTNRDIEAYSHLFSTIDKRKLALIEHPERSRYYYSLLMKGLKKGRIVSSFA
ncbi:MAG TPA: hypothetical protein EYP24_04630, partial [bacterium (Candidatus Stahlbacteria)]|nr:hypothetical protein [Candidatus Stahlbacteria bacterium]